MAERPDLTLEFLADGCPDCGRRIAEMPVDPVSVPDDFNWKARDYEAFRQFMLEDLAAADPERQRWTSADMEVALVEVLAAGLDRASHALDTVFAERFLATARRPDSLVNLLKMIDGIDPAWEGVGANLVEEERERYGFTTTSGVDQVTGLRNALTARPQLMDVARTQGLEQLGEIQSFITLDDLADFLSACPIIAQTMLRYRIEAGFGVYEAVVLLTDTGMRLHDLVSELGTQRDAFAEFFFDERDRAIPPDQAVHGLKLIDDTMLDATSIRTALTRLIQPLLPIGTDLRLLDGNRVGIYLRLCVHVADNYYRSEVEMVVRQTLSAESGQFFDPANLAFGEPLYLSDLQEALMKLPGVAGVVINRFQIAGRPETDATTSGVLAPGKGEAMILDNADPSSETGYILLQMSGGLLG